MKQILIIALIMVLAACSSGSRENNAEIKFIETALDLGTLEYKHPQTVSFEIDNVGEAPLVIFDVKTSCGCTVPQWEKRPVKPGKQCDIQVTYDSDFPGMFRKTITVFYNGANSPDTLIIKGEVEYPEELSCK